MLRGCKDRTFMGKQAVLAFNSRPRKRKKRKAVVDDKFLSENAPAVIVACSDLSKSGFKNEQHYYLVDVAIALEHFMLEATNEGLGTCWIGSFDEEIVNLF